MSKRVLNGIILIFLLAGCQGTPAAPTQTLTNTSPAITELSRLPSPSFTQQPTLISPTPKPSSTPSPATLTATLTPTTAWLPSFHTELDAWGTEGLFSGSVLIAHNDEILLEVAYGLSERSAEVPNRIDTRFNLGSMNKMFTAVSILQLAQAGILSLDEPIQQYIPDYPNNEVGSQLTIHHLLTHTAGLGDVFTPDFQANPHQFRSNADYLPLFVNDPLQVPPGEQFRYSNAGYVVLGLIIERVSGQTYDDYVRQQIFEPSGMLDTGPFALDSGTPNMAVGYTTRDFYGQDTGLLTSNTNLIPIQGFAAGGGYSTVGDLFRFRQALLNFELLSPEWTDLLLTQKVAIQTNSGYAYGFLNRVVGGQVVIGHTGGAPGICSFLYYFPEREDTVIVLSNSDEGCVLVLEYLKENPF